MTWTKYIKRSLRSALCDVLPLKMPALTAESLIASTFAFWQEVVFVQIGAHNGVSNDPIAKILKEQAGWRGLSVEPVPAVYELLIANRGASDRFRYANVAIGSESGIAPFYSVDPNGDEEWLSQVSSFDREHVQRHVAGRTLCKIVEHHIPVRTLQTALREADISRYDLLVIDAEGYDLPILRQAVPTLPTAKMVILEVDHLSEAEKCETNQIFENAGFTIFSIGGDYAAIKRPPRWLKVGYKSAIVRSDL